MDVSDRSTREVAPRPTAADAPAPVIGPRPIRILVISHDLAYRERAMTVLSELGRVTFAVAPLSEPGDIASLLQKERAEVVVLDATGCEAAAPRVIATLADVAPRTGVVVVCHHCTAAARELGRCRSGVGRRTSAPASSSPTARATRTARERSACCTADRRGSAWRARCSAHDGAAREARAGPPR